MSGIDPNKALFNLENAQILLIEGDTMAMTILSQIMLGFNARNVIRCVSVAAAKDHVGAFPVDLVIIDPSTLTPDGFDFVPWLRRHAPKHARFASVLAVTSHTQVSKVASARDSGMNFIVTKPLTPAVIFERIMWMAREKRPYVECKAYAGPDRRFKDDGPPLGETGRREEDAALTAKFAPERELNQKDIDQIMTPGKRAP